MRNINRAKGTYENTKTISQYFQNKLILSIAKLLKNQSKPEDKNFLNYLKTRNNLIMNYTVGEEEEDIEKTKYKGILIEFKQYEKTYLENAAKSYKNLNLNYNDSIFIINIPLIIFNLKDSLFFNKKQCFLSTIFTEKEVIKKDLWLKTAINTGCNNKKNNSYEKVKIKLVNKNINNGIKIIPIEFLFSKLLINSLNYFQNSKQSLNDINNINFNNQCKKLY